MGHSLSDGHKELAVNIGIRLRLTVMMVLEYAIWGAWSAAGGLYLTSAIRDHGLGLSGAQVGLIFSMLPLATIFAPMLAGQIADRWMNTEWLLALCHVMAGVALIVMGSERHFGPLAALMFFSSIFYAPTLALTNSITFSHLSSSEREFGGIRVGGTIGWILAGWMLTGWRTISGISGNGDVFYLAGVLALVLAVFCLFLPATPPKGEGTDPFAFLKALTLFLDWDFAIFMAISFVVGTELMFYYLLTSPFLGAPRAEHGVGIAANLVPMVMTLAQAAEFTVMLLLPLFLRKWGVRKTLVIGILAWPIRYAIFAFFPYPWLVIPALALHGLCYVFFFVVGYIYVDQVAPADIRASAQALVAVVVLGGSMFVGSIVAGNIQSMFTHSRLVAGKMQQVSDWRTIFLIPCAMTVICALVFPLLFRGSKRRGRMDHGSEGAPQPPVP
ncbi:MAG: MFS transporter [Armatimonadetes bacterium]|nr:MFS transporter [Armatimonadota bacterium]MDE2206161.1 MFS transporter [Armatimonadota bacterium]